VSWVLEEKRYVCVSVFLSACVQPLLSKLEIFGVSAFSLSIIGLFPFTNELNLLGLILFRQLPPRLFLANTWLLASDLYLRTQGV